MAKLEEMSKDELQNALARFKKKEEMLRHEQKAQGRKMAQLLFSTAGALGGAYLDGSMVKSAKASDEYKNALDAESQEKVLDEKAKIGGLDWSLAVGLGLGVVGFAGLTGDYDDTVLDLGQGMIAANLARQVYDSTSKPEVEEA